MTTGTVKSFDVARGYGFIRPADRRGEIFVHISAVEQSHLTRLVEGEEVEYQVVCNRAGTLMAVNIKPMSAQR
jgi:CspA family cold shock protein